MTATTPRPPTASTGTSNFGSADDLLFVFSFSDAKRTFQSEQALASYQSKSGCSFYCHHRGYMSRRNSTFREAINSAAKIPTEQITPTM